MFSILSPGHYNNILIMQDLKPILDTDFEYRFKPLKTKTDTETKNEMRKIFTVSSHTSDVVLASVSYSTAHFIVVQTTP